MIKFKFCVIIIIISFLGMDQWIILWHSDFSKHLTHSNSTHRFLEHSFYLILKLDFVFLRTFDLLSENFLLYEFIYSSPRTAHKNSQTLLYGIWRELWRKFRPISFSHWGLWTPVRHTKKTWFQGFSKQHCWPSISLSESLSMRWFNSCHQLGLSASL